MEMVHFWVTIVTGYGVSTYAFLGKVGSKNIMKIQTFPMFDHFLI